MPVGNAPGRRRTCRGSVECPLARLLDDDHVGGLLGRIRAVAYLIGAASEVEPTQIRAAGWLIESLADEAGTRLREALRWPIRKGCQGSQGPV